MIIAGTNQVKLEAALEKIGGERTIYYCISERFRWKWLILLSFIFVYASGTFGALVILLTCGVVYFAARKIEKSSEAKEKSAFC